MRNLQCVYSTTASVVVDVLWVNDAVVCVACVLNDVPSSSDVGR